MRIAMDDLRIEHLWVVYPGKDAYKLAKNITVTPLINIPSSWNYETDPKSSCEKWDAKNRRILEYPL
jgi:hypothetical protein